MKKITAILFCCLLMTATFAQNTGDAGESVSSSNSFKKFRFGIKIYPALDWLKPNETSFSNEGLRFGFGYGVITEIGFSKNYSFLTGAELQTIGGKITYPNYIEDKSIYYTGATTAKVNIGYVNIPLQLKLKTNQIGMMTYFAKIGFDFGVQYKAKADYVNDFDLPGKDNTTKTGVNISDQTRLFRAGLVVGLGMEYNISGHTSLVVGASFHNGFLNVFNKNWPNYKTDSNNHVLLSSNNGKIEAVKQSDNAKAVSNYIAVNLGVIF